MSPELSELTSGPASVQSAFDNLLGIHDETADFFSNTLDELESLSLELFARHKCLELNAQYQAENEAADAAVERRFAECMDELREVKANVCAVHEETAKMWSEISTRREELLKERAEFDKIREELRRSNEQAAAMRDGLEQGQIASEQRQNRIEEQLERLANAVEKAAVSAPSGRDEQLVQAVEAARQQQANWQQDRASLEAELRAERQRTSQQSDALAEQRRTAAEQQAELAGELKRMRSLLEHLLNHMRQPASGAGDGKAMPASPENAALESMLAQFEMLQRDLAQRRAGERKDIAKTLRTSQT